MRIPLIIILALSFGSSLWSQGEKNSAEKPRKMQIRAFFDLDLTPDQRSTLRQLSKNLREAVAKFSETKPDGTALYTKEDRRNGIEAAKEQAFAEGLKVLTPEQRLQFIDQNEDAQFSNPDLGKTISVDLLAQIKTLGPKAGQTTLLAPNSIDHLAKPEFPACNDEQFARRVYLDLIGRTPSVEELLQFTAEDSPKKREILVDQLLSSPEFADYQALHWCDTLRVKSEFPIKLWPNGAAVYHRWIRSELLNNRPYDEFARSLLLAAGSNFRNPPANFYRAVKETDPHSLAAAVALTFMGVRLEHWPEEKQQELSHFFANVAYKPTSEWKEEIIYWNREKPAVEIARLPDGSKVKLSRAQDPRRAFTDWLVQKENTSFNEAIVNRVWFWMTGQGIVHEPDDFRPENPPSNPALLTNLGKAFAENDYDLKKLYKWIACSRTYQQQLPGYTARPMDAEVLQDTFCRIFGTTVSYQSDVPEPFSFYPETMPSITIPDGTVTSKFLMTFGRPARDSGLLLERSPEVTEAQRLYFINSTDLNTWIQKSWLLQVLPLDEVHLDTTIGYLWLNVLSRFPTEQELTAARTILKPALISADRQVLQDLCWSLINLKEFSMRH